MQRIDVPNDIAKLAGEWLMAAMKDDTKFFNDPKNQADGRVFYTKFEYPGVDKNATEAIVAKLTEAFEDPKNKDFLQAFYKQAAEVANGMQAGLNEQNIKRVNEYKQALLQGLLQDETFQAAWKKLGEKAGNENLEQMKLKILSGVMYRVIGEATKAIVNAKQPEMDRGSYGQFIKVVNDSNPPALIQREYESNSRQVQQQFDPGIALSAISKNNEANLKNHIENFKTTIDQLHKIDPEFKMPKNKFYAVLGEKGKAVANEAMINYIKAIQADKSNPAMAKQLLEQIAPAIREHLNKYVQNSNDPKVKETGENLLKMVAPYLNKELKFSPSVEAVTNDFRQSRMLSSSTAMMLNQTTTPQQQEVQRKKIEEMKKDAPMSGKIVKRDRPTPNTGALAPTPPTPAPNQARTPEPEEPKVTTTPSMRK